VQAPLLYLQAAQDRIVPASAAAEIQRIQPRARIMRIAGPHGLLQTQPVACAAAMTSVFSNPHSACC
jgi:pimeloyl-[acyl-carrier protein] methyl ester esterase